MPDRLHLARAPDMPPTHDQYRFEAADHTYWFRKANDSVWSRMLGVTSVLGSVGIADYSWMRAARDPATGRRVPPPAGFTSWLDFWLWRGSAVHGATELVDAERNLDLNGWLADMDRLGFDDIRRRINAYKDFLRDSKAQVMLTEQRIFVVTMGYAGTLDKTMLINGKPTLPDVKCSDQHATAIQTAAYELGLTHLAEIGVDYEYAQAHHERFGLELRADGKYHLNWYGEIENFTDRETWLAALSVAHWKFKHLGKL